MIAIVTVLLFIALSIAPSAGMQPLGAGPFDQDVTGVAASTSPLLQYQGRLTDPSTGQAVADGSYSMTFRLYTVDSGGTALWTETKDVAVQSGLFNTALGDTTALSQALFNGQQLWLGIKVGADDEATPRQRILPAAYALGLVPGAAMQADSTSAALQVTNLGTGDALNINGQTTLVGDLSVSGSLSGGSHAHSGADITSGTVAEARIDAAIARDSEILPAVLANDGAGSGLDADLLDGLEASAFVTSSHTHSGGDITSGTVAEPRIDAALARDSEILPTVLASDGTGSGLDADLLDGWDVSAFATSLHAHSGGDITSGTVAEARVDASLARDSEIMPTVLANGGTGSGLDADLLDGYHISSLFVLNQDEIVTGRPAFNGGDPVSSPPFTVDSDVGVTNLNADLVDGYHATAFSLDGHGHDGADITSGTVSEFRIDPALARDEEVTTAIGGHSANAEAHHTRYTDGEAWGAVLASDGPDSGLHADLLDGYHASTFSFQGHDHDGSQITSGVVAEAHIDGAITRDLEMEGSITAHQGDPSAHHARYTDDEAWGAVLDRDGPGTGLNADMLDWYHATDFAGASHDHLGQSWSGSFSGSYGLSVNNTAAGDGIRGYSSSGSALDGGLYGYSYSTGSGVVGRSTGGNGVYGDGPTGVYGESSDNNGQGVSGHGSGTLTEGVVGTSAQGTGVYGLASASTGGNAIGVWGHTNYTYGFYTGEWIYTGQGCVNCSAAYVAQSADAQPLEIGDIVSISGIAPPLAGGQTPILTVSRASDTDQGLLGVVQSRAVVDAGQALLPSEHSLERDEVEIAGTAPGRVSKGDYLFVVVQGLAQVRVDASAAAVEVGDAIGPAARSGAARTVDLNMAPAPVLGRALEPLPEGTGLVWTLILGQ
jgi:hypothetical protein